MTAPPPGPSRAPGLPPTPADAPPPAEILDEAGPVGGGLFGAADAPAAVLFGAADGARIRPGVVVNLDGVDLAPGPVGGALPTRVVVDGLSFTWGREELLAHPDPSTARFDLFHPDAAGFASAQSQVIGRPVTFRWTTPDLPAGVVNFRGRVSGVQARRKSVTAPDGSTVHGLLASYTATSLVTDLANRRASAAGWDRETIAQRLAFLRQRVGGVVNNLVFRDYWQPAPLAPVAVVTTSVWEVLANLYDSSGVDRMVWVPDTMDLTWLGRRESTGRGLASLWWDLVTDTTTRAGKGAYIRSFGGTVVGPCYIDGRGIEYNDAAGIAKAQGSGATRAVLDWRDPNAADAQRTITYTVPGVSEEAVGARSANLDTFHNGSSWADLCAQDLRDIISTEGAFWRTEPMRWDTRRTDGFETMAQVRLLLRGAESNDPVFLQGSWLAELGLRPAVGIMGGTVSFRRGFWDIEFQAAQVGTRDVPQHAITWEEVDDGSAQYELQWWDEDHRRGFHESVTYEDMGFVSRGLTTTTGPDTGWDTPQL